MKENNLLKNITIIAGFIAIVATIAGGVYAVMKYLDRKQEEEFMDYYFDDDDMDDELCEPEEPEDTAAPQEPAADDTPEMA